MSDTRGPRHTPSPAGLPRRLFLLALLGPAPAWLALAWLVWQAPWLVYAKVFVLVGSACCWLGGALALRRRAEFQLNTIGNVIEAMSAGDYSLRLRPAGAQDVLALQLNRLVDVLHAQRLRSEEALRLVDSVVQHMDVAIFAFDPAQQLRLANPTALTLLQRRSEQVLGQPAQALGLQALLEADTESLHEHVFAGGAGLWRVQRHRYPVEAREHVLLFVTDLQQVLRSEELQAWRRLLRVLSHEVNNSLVPLSSLSESLRRLLQQETHPPDCMADLDEGLTLMQDRARHLADFIRRYAQLARMPEPHKQRFDLAALLRRLPAMLPQAGLQLDIADAAGQALPDTHPLPFFGDPAQIEQMLINLLKNGVEAGGAPLRMHCQVEPLQIQVLDRGPGIANPANLFVPFYTTKAEGTGIGLVLSRQIAEAHGGLLSLENRRDGPGCAAVLRFAAPSAPAAQPAGVM